MAKMHGFDFVCETSMPTYTVTQANLHGDTWHPYILYTKSKPCILAIPGHGDNTVQLYLDRHRIQYLTGGPKKLPSWTSWTRIPHEIEKKTLGFAETYANNQKIEIVKHVNSQKNDMLISNIRFFDDFNFWLFTHNYFLAIFT